MSIYSIVSNSIFGLATLFTAFIVAIQIATQELYNKWVDLTLMISFFLVGAISLFTAGVELGKILK